MLGLLLSLIGDLLYLDMDVVDPFELHPNVQGAPMAVAAAQDPWALETA